MQPVYLQYERSEHVIAVARVLLAALAVLVVQLDPTIAAEHSRVLVVTSVAFSVYSLVLAWHAWKSPLQSQSLRWITHVIDLIVATVLVALTQTPVSPVFQLYTFILFCSALRFRVSGVIATGAAVMVLYSGIGLVRDVPSNDPAFFIYRLAGVAMTTLLLAYLRHHRQRMHDDLMQLASWPAMAFREREPFIRTTLDVAASVLGAPRVAIVFEQNAEPWLWLALRSGTDFRLEREGADLAVIDPKSADATFFCADVTGQAVTIVARDNAVETLDRCPMDADLAARLNARAVLSTPFSGEAVEGRLFFLDRGDITHDEIILSAITARLLAARLDEFALLERRSRTKLGEERVRLARDLHDTLLQSLTAMGLQLEAAIHHLNGDTSAAKERIRVVQDIIARDQAELRSFIGQLRLYESGARDALLPLDVRLAELAERIRRQWSIGVSIILQPDDAEVPEPLASSLINLVAESLSNAAKHSGGSTVAVVVFVAGEGAHVVVADNGHGLPFTGTFDLATLEAEKRGPRTLRERVKALGGTLRLHSSAEGTRLEMTVPW